VIKQSKGQLYEGRNWIWSSQWMCWGVCIEDYDCVVWVMSGLMYSIVTLAMFLRVSREFHSRWSSIDITLLVLWNLPVVFWPWYTLKIAMLALNTNPSINHSLWWFRVYEINKKGLHSGNINGYCNPHRCYLSYYV
jgi:hypothetical protein